MKAVSKKRILLSLAAFIIFAGAFAQSNDLFFQIKKQLTIFSDVYKEVAVRYVDEVSPERLMKSAIDGMLSGLDPYTSFVDEGEQQQLEILSSGSYGGIGIEAGFRGDRIVVVAPIDGYPAQRAGIRPGDIIEEINGVSVENSTPDEVQRLTIGDVGTRIEIVISRSGVDRPISFELERERIEVRNISYYGFADGNQSIGYVQINRFGNRTGEELREVLTKLKEQEGLSGIVLDLRNNPGGLLNEAVEVVDKFLEPGVTVAETRTRYESQNETYATEEPALFDDLPVVVLINSGSASASEIVAGALQDLDRAVIYGEKSFGKGLVQTIRPLSYNTSMKMTISKYLIPSGRSIQSIDYRKDTLEEVRTFRTRNGRPVRDGNGIEPDVHLESDIHSELDIALKRDNHYFFYVNDKIAETENNEIPDNLYRTFVQHLIESGFSFETSADEHLDALSEHFKSSEEQGNSQRHLTELKALQRDLKVAQLYDSRPFIENELQREWISQTLTGDERQQALLRLDIALQESIEILRDSVRYESILRP
ncbi:S41 family peptidase [Rhodohalobacter halophilus]|uniref:S41 family peptidase n=1 Tax=Rhodohalobacter halophilus TaxID=1812810 RepID=UPI00083FCCE5|nr:S41 family peptidase [Rhodohalobacter halophilus]